MKTKAEVMKDLAKVRRRKLIVQEKIDTTDEHDNPVEVWSKWGEYRVERCSLWGEEYYAAAAVGEQETVTFELRYLPKFEELNVVRHRLNYEGKIYDIKGTDPLKDDGLCFKIRALRKPNDDKGIMLTEHPLVKNLANLFQTLLEDPRVGIEEVVRTEYAQEVESILEE